MTSNHTETSEILTDVVNDERPIWRQSSPHTPSRIMPGWLARWVMEIRSHLNPPAPWVVLLGLDGSGKSTVLAALETIFSPPAFPETRIISRHPGFLYDRLLQVKPSSHHSDDGPIAIEHYGKPPHGAIKSVGKLGILALDWFAGYWGQLVHQRAKGQIRLLEHPPSGKARSTHLSKIL